MILDSDIKVNDDVNYRSQFYINCKKSFDIQRRKRTNCARRVYTSHWGFEFKIDRKHLSMILVPQSNENDEFKYVYNEMLRQDNLGMLYAFIME